jgi:hypothetical protein
MRTAITTQRSSYSANLISSVAEMATLQAGVNTVGCTFRQEQVTDKKEYLASTMPSVRQALSSLADDYKFTESSRTEIATS